MSLVKTALVAAAALLSAGAGAAAEPNLPRDVSAAHPETPACLAHAKVFAPRPPVASEDVVRSVFWSQALVHNAANTHKSAFFSTQPDGVNFNTEHNVVHVENSRHDLTPVAVTKKKEETAGAASCAVSVQTMDTDMKAAGYTAAQVARVKAMARRSRKVAGELCKPIVLRMYAALGASDAPVPPRGMRAVGHAVHLGGAEGEVALSTGATDTSSSSGDYVSLRTFSFKLDADGTAGRPLMSAAQKKQFDRVRAADAHLDQCTYPDDYHSCDLARVWKEQAVLCHVAELTFWRPELSAKAELGQSIRATEHEAHAPEGEVDHVLKALQEHLAHA